MMSTQANALSASVSAPAEISAIERIFWAVQREFWEYRSIYIAPFAVAPLALVGSLISTARLTKELLADATHRGELVQQPYDSAGLLLMFTTFLVALFYSVDALYGERRDRSILFWKSMPVSDLTTVLAKASIPIVVLPLLTFTIIVVTHGLMLLMSGPILLAKGVSAATLWSDLSLFHMWWMLFYHLLALHGIWYAPLYAWLLMAGAWARRAPILWATLPLLAIGLLERLAFNTSHFGHLLGDRLYGNPGPPPATSSANSMSIDAMTRVAPIDFVTSPGLWIGLAVAAVFLAAAVRLRRSQGPI